LASGCGNVKQGVLERIVHPRLNAETRLDGATNTSREFDRDACAKAGSLASNDERRLVDDDTGVACDVVELIENAGSRRCP